MLTSMSTLGELMHKEKEDNKVDCEENQVAYRRIEGRN